MKSKLKIGQKAAVVGAPAGCLPELDSLTEDVHLSDHPDGKFGWLQVFVKNKKELVAFVPHILAAMQAESLLWITFPKGSSKVQIDRDKGWDSLRGPDLKWINLVSVNATWSAVSLRPYHTGVVHQSFR